MPSLGYFAAYPLVPAAFALIPYAALAMMPVRVGFVTAAGLVIPAVAYAVAITGSDFLYVQATLIVSGALSGLIASGIRTPLRDRNAPWHAHVVIIVVGIVTCVPMWLGMAFGVWHVATGLRYLVVGKLAHVSKWAGLLIASLNG